MNKILLLSVLFCANAWASLEPQIKKLKKAGNENLLVADQENNPFLCYVQSVIEASYEGDHPAWPNFLTKVAESGNQQACMLLLESVTIPVDAINTRGYTALIGAARHGHTDMCKYLLSKNADLEKCDEDGRTALMRAAHSGHLKTCCSLLEAGANLDSRDIEKTTALMHAAMEGHVPVCIILLQAGANLSLIDVYGHTALTIACQHWEVESCKALIGNASFLPHQPRAKISSASRKRVTAALLAFDRINTLPRDLRRYILQCTSALRKDLARIFISLVHSGKAHLIPKYYRFILSDVMAQESVKRLKPLMREALFYAHNPILMEVLDDELIEESYGKAILEANVLRVKLLTN